MGRSKRVRGGPRFSPAIDGTMAMDGSGMDDSGALGTEGIREGDVEVLHRGARTKVVTATSSTSWNDGIARKERRRWMAFLGRG